MADIPERLKRNGRPEDQDFQATEKLFRRYRKADWQGMMLNVSLSSAPSVNRQKFSEVADVLIHPTDAYADMGVVSFRVRDIPQEPLLDPGPATHTFFPRHVPGEDNYAHSEVWCAPIGQQGPHVEPNKLIRKMFRTLLGQAAVVEIAAKV